MFLHIDDVTVKFGEFAAVKDISLEIPDGPIFGLLGANGAGKSTLFKAICGLIHPVSGNIFFNQKNITGKRTPEILRRGIAMIPEGKQLFPDMTVLDNIKLGAFTRKDKAAVDKQLEQIFERYPMLRAKQRSPAGTLSGGVQQLVAIARGLLSNPQMLLFDEPCQGLAPLVIKEVGGIIKDINASGITVIVIEHNVRFVLGLVDKIYIMGSGRIIDEGIPGDISEAEYTQRIYLGR
jgi:branched-chain amino acid transport system ATP-binding protein